MRPARPDPARTRPPRTDPAWSERAGRLFEAYERPAKAMVRRAFRGAFCADELDDVYAAAWMGTLRALAGRQGELTDDEIRSYLLTAVANQASKELRRRRRKPTAPLDLVGSVADDSDGPEERAASRERSLMTRDVLTSLPPRRRAVMLLRYGWGLEPSQVCRLVDGLSPRAYRKEITRGVDEVTSRLRTVESGDWCVEREPLLKAVAAGTAGEDEERQARAHLSHCRSCAGFVSELGSRLHDLGAGAALAGSLGAAGSSLGPLDRLLALMHRLTGPVADGPAPDAGAGAKGAAGAGALTKLAGLGAGGKLALACVGGGIAVTACVAAGVSTGGIAAPPGAREVRHPARAKPAPAIGTPPAVVAPATQRQPTGPPPGSSAEPAHRDRAATRPARARPSSSPPAPAAGGPSGAAETEFGFAAPAPPAAGEASGSGTPPGSAAPPSAAPPSAAPPSEPRDAAESEFGLDAGR